MAYGSGIEKLLSCLGTEIPLQAEHLRRSLQDVEHGLISVGLKIHCLEETRGFNRLIAALGGKNEVLERNVYRKENSAFCLVLPPLGNARAAVELLSCIGTYVGESLFGNPNVQLQVCSPGRLDAQRSALHAILFYLGSDTLRRYTPNQFVTSVSFDGSYNRGRRIVLYDAGTLGIFERNFPWWEKRNPGLHIEPLLPFTQPARTDIMVGSGSEEDVHNINLIATLLVHAQFPQYNGFWRELGLSFEREAYEILSDHLLTGLLQAPWVHEGGYLDARGDNQFFSALQELMAYAFGERGRAVREVRLMPFSKRRFKPGILQEVDNLLDTYRKAIVARSSFQEGA